jgi:hypothetical protein
MILVNSYPKYHPEKYNRNGDSSCTFLTKRKRLVTALMHHSLNKLTKNEENKL